MRIFTTFSLALVVATVNVPSAHAQMILTGCTASLTGQPMTTSRLLDIDPSTGLGSIPRDTGIFFLGGIATQPSTGGVFGLTTSPSVPPNSLIRIDLMTGIPTVVGPIGLTSVVEGDLAFNPVNGQLFGVQTGVGAGVQRNLFQINPNSGAGTLIGPTGSTGDLSALSFDNAGNLYAIDTGAGGPENSLLYSLNPLTGTISTTTNLNVNLGSGAGLAFHPFTGVAYVADGGVGGTNQLYTLDVSIGVLTSVGAIGFTPGLSGLTFVNVPEPSSIAILGGVLIAMLAKKVRRFRISSSKIRM